MANAGSSEEVFVNQGFIVDLPAPIWNNGRFPRISSGHAPREAAREKCIECSCDLMCSIVSGSEQPLGMARTGGPADGPEL